MCLSVKKKLVEIKGYSLMNSVICLYIVFFSVEHQHPPLPDCVIIVSKSKIN